MKERAETADRGKANMLIGWHWRLDWPLLPACSAPKRRTRNPRMIISRHGEKKDGAKLCKVGKLRAQALAVQYLGKDAPGNDTIFGKGGQPDAFFAVTVHTQETAQPSAESWGKQLTVFSQGGLDKETKDAAAALELDGVQWQDRRRRVGAQAHCRRRTLQGRRMSNTLRALLKLDQIPGADVPVKWDGDNYDYFWIVDYTGPQPTFTVIQQDYAAAAYAQVPNNAWGVKVEKSQFPEFYKDCEH